MTRRSFLALAGSALQQPRPNILLIMGDNQQWGTIANRTMCRTPNINRLAAEGMLFERSYTTAAVCSPARNALLTGSFNWKFGTYNHPDTGSAIRIDMFPDVVTYAMRLREAGYRIGYNGKWHSSTVRTPMDLGYDEIGAPNRYKGEALRKLRQLGMANISEACPKKTVRTVSWPGSEPFGLWGYSECEEEQSELYHVADAGIGMMKRFAAGSAPWMVEIHFPEAFRAWPLRKYRERYRAESIPVAKSFRDDFRGKPGMQVREAESYGRMSDGDFQEGRAFYYASFEQLDTQVGRILAALEETGQAGRTLVVFAADHGAPWGAHRMWLPCFAPYEETYRIPMVARWPGRIKPGGVCDRLVQLHDLAHTVVDIAGGKALPHPHGISLAPLFDNPGHGDWRDMIQCPWYGQNFLLSHRITTTARYKYVFNHYDLDECYDLGNDPDELRNVARDRKHAAAVGDMQARTYELMNKYEDPYGDSDSSARFHSQRYLPRGKRVKP